MSTTDEAKTGLLLGTETSGPDNPVEISKDGLLHHTLVVGQSGSGKSYSVARLVEEILLRSRARVLIIDPNGDFRQIHRPSSEIWTNEKCAPQFENLNAIANSCGIRSLDTSDGFVSEWTKRRFVYLVPGNPPKGLDSEYVLHRRLVLQWDGLDEEQRDFLLSVDPVMESKVALGLEACLKCAQFLELRNPAKELGYDLRSMLTICQDFADRNINLKPYAYAKTLSEDDWDGVRARLSEVLRRHGLIWWSRGSAIGSRPPSLSAFIDGGLNDNHEEETYWDAMTLTLDAALQEDALLSVDVALARMWKRAKDAWRRQASASLEGRKIDDQRVPTFIVIDEAHNFAPQQSDTPLRRRVTRRLIQIASEGRKYGLYLILATQRPTKLHKELVPECENTCVLRVQSEIETNFLTKVLAIPEDDAKTIPKFGLGRALISGRWVNSPQPVDTKIAPARSVVGGGGVSDCWLQSPEPSRPFENLRIRVQNFVESSLRASDEPVTLSSLAYMLSGEFDELYAGHWLDNEGLRPMVESLGISNLKVAPLPPGYVFLSDVHAAPEAIVPKTFSWVDDSTQQQQLSEAHRLIDLPALPSETYRLILEVISEEVRETEFNLTEVSKAVRDEVKRRGESVARAPISYILKGISWSGHVFDPDLPQEPRILAAAFLKTVERTLRDSASYQLDKLDPLVSYISGGLISTLGDTGHDSTDPDEDPEPVDDEPSEGEAPSKA